jgi:hypothetical protein
MVMGYMVGEAVRTGKHSYMNISTPQHQLDLLPDILIVDAVSNVNFLECYHPADRAS